MKKSERDESEERQAQNPGTQKKVSCSSILTQQIPTPRPQIGRDYLGPPPQLRSFMFLVGILETPPLQPQESLAKCVQGMSISETFSHKGPTRLHSEQRISLAESGLILTSIFCCNSLGLKLKAPVLRPLIGDQLVDKAGTECAEKKLTDCSINFFQALTLQKLPCQSFFCISFRRNIF